jgi:outer membrane protein OmpA-like peptidoglycan-associated protein
MSPSVKSFVLLLATVALLAGCAQPSPPPQPQAPAVAPPPPAPAAAPAAPPAAPAAAPAAPAPPPPPPPILPFDDAVLAAANNLLNKAQLPPGTKHSLLIDPLIDGVTGMQTAATKAMGARIAKLVRDSYPQRYDVIAFNGGNVARGPLVLIGTFTGVNAERKTEGRREAYRICLALADLKTGKLVSKGLAFAKLENVDPTPLPYYRDAPAWSEDGPTTGYIRTCQGTRAGDPINPLYVDRIVTAATLAEASDAYSAGQYAEALKLYEAAKALPGGEQLRTYTGLYLSNWRLGKQAAAAQAFGQIVNQGLEAKRLGVKFLFRPGTPAFFNDPGAKPPAPYSMWVNQIATNAAKRNVCLAVVGHTSPTGSEPVNERLSLLRAQAVSGQIAKAAPALAKRLSPMGVGSRETMVGNGRDDASDALDRRVEFKVATC